MCVASFCCSLTLFDDELNETWLLERRDPIPMGCLSPRKKSFIGHVGGVCRIPWNYTRFIDVFRVIYDTVPQCNRVVIHRVSFVVNDGPRTTRLTLRGGEVCFNSTRCLPLLDDYLCSLPRIVFRIDFVCERAIKSNLVERIHSLRIYGFKRTLFLPFQLEERSIAEIGNFIFDEKKKKKRTCHGKTSENTSTMRLASYQGFQTDPTEDLPRFAQVDHLASLLDRSSKTYLCWSCTILRAKGRGERRGIACASTSLPPLFLSVPSINCPIQRGRLPRRTNCSTEIGTRNNSCIADGRESLWRDPYHRLLPPG